MNQVELIVQRAFSAIARDKRCRRAICLHHGFCVPPRSKNHPSVFRCPFDSEEDWQMRFAAVQKLGERMKRILERQLSALGKPSPFEPPSEPDPLDIDQPLDLAALFRRDSPPADREKPAK